MKMKIIAGGFIMAKKAKKTEMEKLKSSCIIFRYKYIRLVIYNVIEYTQYRGQSFQILEQKEQKKDNFQRILVRRDGC